MPQVTSLLYLIFIISICICIMYSIYFVSCYMFIICQWFSGSVVQWLGGSLAQWFSGQARIQTDFTDFKKVSQAMKRSLMWKRIQKTKSMVSSLKDVWAKIFASMLLRHILVVSPNITSFSERNEYENAFLASVAVQNRSVQPNAQLDRH